jgi:hypothetical protein
MESEQLTEDQEALITCAIRYGAFPPKNQYLADGDKLYDRGWFDRSTTDDAVIFRLLRGGRRGARARETGVDELMPIRSRLLRQPGGFEGFCSPAAARTVSPTRLA